MRQIAVLPYRFGGADKDGPTEILLVTSRGTGRWVVPKGNPLTGLDRHASAAIEAEEEAGVLGAVCPTSIGSYEYRKRRANGAAIMYNVEVFPLAVTRELDEWKEMDERERRWFTLDQAASSVDEPDLQAMIRSFGDRGFRAAAQRSGVVFNVAEKTGVNRMFAWFQRLLPKQGNFFELFEAHAATLTAGAEALARMLQGGEGMADHVQEIIEREHDADAITREVLQTVRRTFLTPFDRSAITDLIASMDDAIDEMQKTAGAVDLYDVTEFEPEMRDIAGIIVDAARLTAEALPLLRNISANGARLHELTERLVRMEGHADDIHAAGLKRLFKEHGEANPTRFLIARELFRHLERVTDSFEDVANEIDGLVIDHA
jgi:predicted phosphate transport protein (TIGR00153 family)